MDRSSEVMAWMKSAHSGCDGATDQSPKRLKLPGIPAKNDDDDDDEDGDDDDIDDVTMMTMIMTMKMVMMMTLMMWRRDRPKSQETRAARTMPTTSFFADDVENRDNDDDFHHNDDFNLHDNDDDVHDVDVDVDDDDDVHSGKLGSRTVLTTR